MSEQQGMNNPNTGEGKAAEVGPMPSVGRIVHYIGHSMGNDPGAPGQLHPAIVTKVHSHQCVNLTVFVDGATTPIVKSSAVLDQDWVWPARV